MFPRSYAFSFGRKLFFSVVGLFLVFATAFILYQYQRERVYKIELQGSKMLDYNDIFYQEIHNHPNFDIHRYLEQIGMEDMRVTIIDFDGNVLYESYPNDSIEFTNHLDRIEIQKALNYGTGVHTGRLSQTTGQCYFYAATRYHDYIIRTAVPYSDSLLESLQTDYNYIWFALVVAVVLIFIFYKVTNSIGSSINQLRQFALLIEQNESYESVVESMSGNDELSEISQHIIRIYQRLHDTKEALYIEREKLIAHLQTSREGLGVFTKDKEEILVNKLFIQYANIISDHNLEKTEDVFNVPEFQYIISFIDRVLKKPVGTEEKRKSVNVNKNGRMFTVECIVFQDFTFEISINDVTLEEEQIIIKRQLTQNIAHELKTPVSSIQGYLETIVTNPSIPPEKAKVFLERCYEQSNRLTRLLRDISVLTRMDEAADMMEMETIDISILVQSIINEVALELEEKNITVNNNLKEKIQIRGNHSLIYSIFRNLMDNSIAYAGNNIQITINCFRENDNLLYFSFSDNGVGINPEHLQRLFERFYRVDKGRSRKLGGTGLGLAIVKNAVLIHGGTIFAKRVQEGGLEFIFTLAKER